MYREISMATPILVGQHWAVRGTNRRVTVTDYEPYRADHPVYFRSTYDPGFGEWMPEDEFREEYDYVEPSDD